MGPQGHIDMPSVAPLLAWINYNLSMDKYHMDSKVCDEITFPFPNFYGATIEVWEWISNFPHIW